MVAAYRNRPSGKRVNHELGLDAPRGYLLHQMELEAEQIPGRDRLQNDGFDGSHKEDRRQDASRAARYPDGAKCPPGVAKPARRAAAADESQRSSPNRKIDSAISENITLGSHAAVHAGISPERPKEDVIPNASQ